MFPLETFLSKNWRFWDCGEKGRNLKGKTNFLVFREKLRKVSKLDLTLFLMINLFFCYYEVFFLCCYFFNVLGALFNSLRSLDDFYRIEKIFSENFYLSFLTKNSCYKINPIDGLFLAFLCNKLEIRFCAFLSIFLTNSILFFFIFWKISIKLEARNGLYPWIISKSKIPSPQISTFSEYFLLSKISGAIYS